MKIVLRAISCVVLLCLAYSNVPAQKDRSKTAIAPPKNYRPPQLSASPELESILKGAVDSVLDPANGKGLKPDEIAATLIDLRDPNEMKWASVAGERPIYPASVVKLFYLAALERQLEDGKVTMTPELTRGLHDMIVVSSNEATQYILDVLTDTASGGELPAAEFDKWQYKRNRVNRFYASMGYTNINVNQKTFCEDAYGIEQQSRRYKGENRNMLTTGAVARLLAEIVTGRMNTPGRTTAMMTLLKRDPFLPSTDPDDQSVGFSGKALIDGKMAGAKLWSKAGWTNKSRHDAAYIEMPEGSKFVLVVFTENHANDRDIVPSVVTKVMRRMMEDRK